MRNLDFDDMVCTGYETNEKLQTCQGDSGNAVLVGITSFVFYACPDEPYGLDVYAKVSKVRSQIKENME